MSTKAVNTWCLVRNVFLAIGFILVLTFACALDGPEESFKIVLAVILIGMVFIAISLFIESVILRGYLDDDIVITTKHHYSFPKEESVFAKYYDWLENNNLEDTEDNFDKWLYS